MMEIIIGENNVKLGSNNGLITGEIYFKINDYYFPERNWNDFLVIILGWWVNSFINAIKTNANKFEFHFMDGPFLAEAVLKDKNLYEICLLERNKNNKTLVMTTNACQKELQNMLIKACRKTFKVVSLSNISCDNTNGLRKLFDELKNFH